MRLAGMVYEAARHRQSRMTEIRVPVGETEVKWEERGRGKANMWSGSELVLCPKVQSAESFLHPSFIMSQKSNSEVLIKHHVRLLWPNASRTWQAPNRHQPESCSAAGILCLLNQNFRSLGWKCNVCPCTQSIKYCVLPGSYCVTLT